MAPAQISLWVVLGVALVVSVITDLLQRRILDVVTYPVIAVALFVRFATDGVGGMETGLVAGVVGAVLGLLPFGLFAWRGTVGWGDAKLMAAVGAAFGYPLVMAALVFVSLVGALQAVVALIWHGEVWDTLTRSARRWAARVGRKPAPELPPGRHIPYGIAIALGSFWAMWWDRSGTM
jgi:prepilin peptidase CpaA